MTQAGDDSAYTVTFLEMDAAPSYPRPSLPLGPPTALMAAEKPPLWYFLDLYRAVGANYDWTDRLHDDPKVLQAMLHDPCVRLYTLMRAGWPAGFFMLDWRATGVVELSYFGLVPEAIGLGLGKYLLRTAVHAAWDIPGTEKMTVNTCSLDHPRALPLYQMAGFEPVRQEHRTRAPNP